MVEHSGPFQPAAVHKDLKNDEYVWWRAFLRGAENWDASRIRGYQLAELRRVLTAAYRGTDGYRELYTANGFHPSSLTTLDDIRRVPLVSKEAIRDELARFTIRQEGADYVTTGGSTGVPLGFWRDPPAFAKELASKAHQYQRIGWEEGDRQIVFRGLAIDSEEHWQFVPEFNELRCSSYHLVQPWVERFVELAWEYRPDWIRCYPSSATILAEYLDDHDIEFPPVKGLLCASENLYDWQIKLFDRVFGGRTFSHYGHYELAALAGFCESEDTYHVLPFYGFAELLDPDGEPVTTPGETGEIVATSFTMGATPFVRYRTGDLAVFGGIGCKACGRPYEIWTQIEGRLQDFVVSTTGRRVSMTAMNMHDDVFDDLREFQFYQDDLGEVQFRYVTKPGRAPDLEYIRRVVGHKMGEGFTLELRAVDELERTKRGKHRVLIQNIEDL